MPESPDERPHEPEAEQDVTRWGLTSQHWRILIVMLVSGISLVVATVVLWALLYYL